MKCKHIGFSSPVSTLQLADHLYLKGDEPAGTEGATAPNLLIIELLKLGYQITVFSLSMDVTADTTVHGKNLTIHYLPKRLRARHFTSDLYLQERRLLKSKILAIKPDVLHAHWQYEYAWAAIDSGIRTVVTCRDSPVKVLLYYKNMLRFIRLIVAYIVLKKAKVITATSSYLAAELKKFGVKQDVHVIPNFEPDWIFEREIVPNKDLKNPTIIMINNGFDDRKNIKTGIAGFQLFRKTYPTAELHLFGHGYRKGEIAEDWAVKTGLAENVRFMGYRNFDDLMDELSRYTMLVHPSKEETFGNILTESMGLGVPVVGGKYSGAVPWVIGSDERGGVLVNVDHAQEIADGMLKIISSQDVYNNYALGARKQAKENFSVDKVVQEYIALYEGQTVETDKALAN
jgi:glycosyltransferase involved in cell wall biosynthesis